MSLTSKQLRHGIDSLCVVEPRFQAALTHVGYPQPRIRARGYTTLLRTIVGQQVSVAAANSIWNKLEARLGSGCAADTILASDHEELRNCGLSAQKQSYAKSLAAMVLANEINFDRLPVDDEEAIVLLTRIKGVGRWSAEIYLLFAEGRPDIWPAGDLAVQEAIGRILQLSERPKEKATRTLAEPWCPHRGAAAILAWHCYNIEAI